MLPGIRQTSSVEITGHYPVQLDQRPRSASYRTLVDPTFRLSGVYAQDHSRKDKRLIISRCQCSCTLGI